MNVNGLIVGAKTNNSLLADVTLSRNYFSVSRKWFISTVAEE
jgi:hypothetical protein